MKAGEQFFNFYNHGFILYNHGFILAAVAIPIVRVADPTFNADQIIALMQKAASSHAAVTLFPELGLSAYSCEDLFQQAALLESCQQVLERVLEASRPLPMVWLWSAHYSVLIICSSTVLWCWPKDAKRG